MRKKRKSNLAHRLSDMRYDAGRLYRSLGMCIPYARLSIFQKERFFENQEVYSEDDLDQMAEDEMTWTKLKDKRFKKKEIKLVDHSKMKYSDFR